nr:sugar phosphate isomerase/epimerase [Bernardetiaceae bacterium]
MNRRQVLQQLSASALAFSLAPFAPLWAGPRPRFRIGACDWSLDAMGKVEALALAQQIGLDGVQVSLGTAQDDMQLRRPEVQKAYRQAAKKHKVAVGGLAIGELNHVPYKTDPRTEQWVADSIQVAKNLKAPVVLLAFFEPNGDLRNDPAGKKTVIGRLKKVAGQAEKAKVTLGIESWLSARESMEIVNAVGSPNVKVYYDVCNSTVRGYDIFEEMYWLGKQNICEIHFKENGSLLGQGQVDYQKVRQVLDEIGYQGWIVLEGAVPNGAKMLPSYVDNNRFV